MEGKSKLSDWSDKEYWWEVGLCVICEYLFEGILIVWNFGMWSWKKCRRNWMGGREDVNLGMLC